MAPVKKETAGGGSGGKGREEEPQPPAAAAAKKKKKQTTTPAKRRASSFVMTEPKNVLGGFLLYCTDQIDGIGGAFPTANFGERARIMAHQYKQLNPKEIVRWEKRALAHYDEELKLSKKRRKDPYAPKRNMSAYLFFATEMRQVVKEHNPDATFGEIAKLLAKEFADLTEEQRQVWDDKALADKERYERERKVYLKAE